MVGYVIVCGQSNARGNTGGVQPVFPYLKPNPNALITGIDYRPVREKKQFEKVEWEYNEWIGSQHGAELSICKNFYPNRVRIIKVSYGGSNLFNQWASGSELRDKLIAYINYAKQYAENNGEIPVWTFYWNQWESDAMITAWADAYEVNYKNLYDEVVSTGIEVTNHLIHKVDTGSSFYSNYNANSIKIYDAQLANKAFYGAKFIESDDLDKHDFVHGTSEAYHTIGTRIYNAIK